MTTYEWLTIIAVLLGGFVTLYRQLIKIEVGLSGKVSYGNCEERQEKCPCHKALKEIQKEMDRLHPHQR